MPDEVKEAGAAIGLEWSESGESCVPDNDAISPLASLGENPCMPMLGKPTVACGKFCILLVFLDLAPVWPGPIYRSSEHSIYPF